MTTDQLWSLLLPVTWVAWGVFALAALALGWIAWRRAAVPPSLGRLASRGQRTFTWLFILTVLLFAVEGSPWQGVEFYARTLLPLWLLCVAAELTFSWGARREERER